MVARRMAPQSDTTEQGRQGGDGGSLHVVIVGGGFAGLFLARRLASAPARVTLVDRRNHHVFQPLLYQVATAGLSAPDVAAPIRHVVRSQRNTTVLLDKRLTPQLINEGLARDIVRNVQNLRKEARLDIADRITLSLVTESKELREAIEQCRDYVAGETLSVDIAANAMDGESAQSVVKIHGQPLTIALMKAS